MKKLDSSDVQCHVFTFKEGLLSAVAHDLKLRLGDLVIEVDDEMKSVRATADAASLEVVCAMADGKEKPSSLSSKDKRDIEKNTRKDVLKTKKFPQVLFTSSEIKEVGDGYDLRGQLLVAGKSNLVTWKITPDHDWWRGSLRMHQPDWGIKPFSAMFGAIKIKPDVEIIVKVRKNALSV